jgi:hypothetical protein
MGFAWARRWATIYRGGPYNVTVSVNVLNETVALGKPSRLVNINRGGRIRLPVSVNQFCEAVNCDRLG